MAAVSKCSAHTFQQYFRRLGGTGPMFKKSFFEGSCSIDNPTF